MTWDIFIGYIGSFTKDGSVDNARELYNIMRALGLNPYFFPETGRGNYGDTPKCAGNSTLFLLVANNSILSKLDENGAVKNEGELLYREIEAFYQKETKRKKNTYTPMRVYCCGGFTDVQADDVFPGLTRNIEHFDEQRDGVLPTVRKVLEWVADALKESGGSVLPKHAEAEPSDEELLKKYPAVIDSMVNWECSLPCLWGAHSTAKEPQNANSCETLVSLKITHSDVKKKTIYKKVLRYLLKEKTDKGLRSKSLNYETVSCTSMLLTAAALEKRDPIGVIGDYSDFDRIAEELWATRNENAGWGMYNTRMNEAACSLTNTFRALSSLLYYPAVSEREEFTEFCENLIERSSGGQFGYFIGDSPKLSTTSLFVSFFYALDKERREQFGKRFRIADVLNFIYDQFTSAHIQTEIEEFFDMDLIMGHGVKRAPFTNMSVYFAMDALAQAYKAGDLPPEQWHGVLKETDSILSNQVRSDGGASCYYEPAGLIKPRQGIYTYPTSYFLRGLYTVKEADDAVRSRIKK